MGTELRGVIFFLYVVGVILVSVVRFGSLIVRAGTGRVTRMMRRRLDNRQRGEQASERGASHAGRLCITIMTRKASRYLSNARCFFSFVIMLILSLRVLDRAKRKVVYRMRCHLRCNNRRVLSARR